MDKIDNRYLHCSYAATFIKDTVISLLAEKLFTGTPAERINKMKKIKTKKVFPFMASADSISVTRSGEKIGVPIFWATLQFYFTEGTDELVVCDSINTIYPYVYYVHPNYIGQFETSANDSLYNLQASLSPTTQYSNGDINVEEAWEVETGKSHVKVGVFDTGIDSLHPDIDVFKRIDIETAMLDVLGSHGVGGHGTSVAGIIGAKRDNYSGIAGIAGGQGNNGSGCKLYDFDEGDDNDGILLEGAVSGIVVGAAQWYYNNSTFSNDVPASIGQGLNVINASWVAHLYQDQINDSSSISWPPDPYECKLCYEAIEFAFRNEVVVSAARGNYPHTNPTNFDQTFYLYPACVKDEFVLNVGSSGYDGEHKIWGNGLQTPSDGYESMYGKGVDVIAPGTLATVYTTKSQTVTPNNSLYKSFNGTSAAAPHVAGVAALMLSHVNTPCPSKKNLAPEDVEYILQKTADDKETFGYNEKSGWGHLNAGKALKAIQEPQYQIIHIDNIPSSINTTFFDTASVYIRNPYEGTSGPYSSGLGIISDGEYYIDIYKTTATVNHLMNLSHLSSSTQIIDKWVRNSSSIGWALNRNVMLAQGWRKDTIDVTTNVFLDTSSFNTTSSTLTAYNYFVKCSVDSTIVVNQWYPRPASQCRFEYSIYVFDSLAVSVPTYPCDSSVDIYEPVLENVNNLNIICAYPNPFVNNFTIEYYSPYDENCYIYVTDLLGRTVTSVAVASIKKGNYKINLDLSNISNGVYFVILSTKENRVYKKILKVN
ncbi:MAG: S8 family serine peptidase [Bacteroidia bacterium]|nr:S8 family serine peptidase [Bacteroidia bacterium]